MHLLHNICICKMMLCYNRLSRDLVCHRDSCMAEMNIHQENVYVDLKNGYAAPRWACPIKKKCVLLVGSSTMAKFD